MSGMFAYWCAECCSETNWTMCNRCVEEEKLKEDKWASWKLRKWVEEQSWTNNVVKERLLKLAEEIEKGEKAELLALCQKIEEAKK